MADSQLFTARNDLLLMQGNMLQSAVITIVAGTTLLIFKPSVQAVERMGKALVVGTGKRALNGLIVYGVCNTLDTLRRNGFNFWFLTNKVGAEGQDEYFLSSTFRFVTFAASSGPSSITNYVSNLLRIGRQNIDVQPQVDDLRNPPKKNGWLISRSRFYDGARLSSETNMGVVCARISLFGISTVLTGAGSMPVTLGPIDNDTHVRVLRKCGPSELAYWSLATGISTLACEAFYNCLFLALLKSSGEAVQLDEVEGSNSIGFNIFSGAVISLMASLLNGAAVYVTSNRAVAVLGEDGNRVDDGILNTICKVIHDKVFCQILNREKGVAYIWARCLSFTTNTFTN